jgi:putative transposase
VLIAKSIAEWLLRLVKTARSQENKELSEHIQEIYADSGQTYGSPRIQAALRVKGFTPCRQRVVRLMKQLNIKARQRRRFRVTTDSQHALPIADNILDRNFTAQQPDQAWVADITYISTHQGWLYLAVVVDLFSRKVVGWSMVDHLRTELVLTALESALGKRVPAQSGLIFYSDRGSQYASFDYRSALDSAGITCSMSRRGNCWDNALAESFFGTLKTEFVHPRIFTTKEVAKTAIASWIEAFYNRKRLHSTIGYLSPVNFEENYWANQHSPT